MLKVAVERLTGGEVLAREVRRPDGTVLLGRGRALAKADRATLARLGVAFVLVEGDRFADEDQRREWQERQELALAERFAPVLDDPFMRALHELFRRRIISGNCLPPEPEAS